MNHKYHKSFLTRIMPIIDAYYTAYRFQVSAQVSANVASVTVLSKTINLSSLRLLLMPLLYISGNLVFVHEITMIDLVKTIKFTIRGLWGM